MSFDAAMRRKVVAHHEGALLTHAQVSTEHAAEMAECIADAAVNVLIRLRGAEAAAHFAFAQSDRVAAGLRAPTVCIRPATPDDDPPPTPHESKPVAPPAQPTVTPRRALIAALLVGLGFGLGRRSALP